MTVWIGLEGIMLSEISQRKILYDLTYVESGGKKKQQQQKKPEIKFTDIENRLVVP